MNDKQNMIWKNLEIHSTHHILGRGTVFVIKNTDASDIKIYDFIEVDNVLYKIIGIETAIPSIGVGLICNKDIPNC